MEVELLEAIRYDNEVRNARSREWIGGMYFLVAYGMLQFTVGIGLMMSYVMPLRRFSSSVPALANQKFVTFVYVLFLAGLFFLVSATAGMTGFVVMGGLLVIWSALLLLIGAIRRCLHSRREKAKIREAQEAEDAIAVNGGRDSAAYKNKLPGPQIAFATPERGGAFGDAGNEDSHAHFGPAESGAFDPHESVAFAASPDPGSVDFGSAQKDLSMQESGGGGGGRRRSSVRGSGNHNRSSAVDKAVRRRMRGMHRWAYCPERISGGQTACFASSLLLLVTTLAVLFVLVYTWEIRDYRLVDDGEAGIEFQPPLAAKALQFMYAFPTIATKLKLQLYVKLFTEYCGNTFTRPLAASEKQAAIYDKWVDLYDINMTLFEPSDWRNYTSVNDWFTRAINVAYRPLPSGPEFVVSPADCRLLVYNNPSDLRIWTKGYAVVYNDLLDNEVVSGSTRYFDNGAIVIARLAPQDYHRFHSPVSGIIVSMRKVTNTYWSVSSDAARSGNDAFLNTRTIIIIDAGPRIGFVAYIGVGATCVGSVEVVGAGRQLQVGSVVERGEQLGSMNFGGSTVLLLFAQGRVLFDSDIVTRSRYAVETLVNVREGIGSTR